MFLDDGRQIRILRRQPGIARGIYSLKTLPSPRGRGLLVGNRPLMVGVPLSSIAQISCKRLKPPQKTVGFFWDWKQITHKQTDKQTNKLKGFDNLYTVHTWAFKISISTIFAASILQTQSRNSYVYEIFPAIHMNMYSYESFHVNNQQIIRNSS